LNAALHTAEAAVSFDKLRIFRRLVPGPPARWLVIQARPKTIDELIRFKNWNGHDDSASQCPSLVQGEQSPAARRTNILVMQLSIGSLKAKIKSDLIEDFFQVLNVHL